MITPVVCGLLVLAVSSLSAQTPPVPEVLPFPVEIGGQQAQKSDTIVNAAVIEKPVAANAKIKLSGVDGVVIINAFPAKDDATPADATTTAKVIMINDGGETSLDKTIDGSKLESGKNLLNIVGGGKTARVLITIE